MVQYLIREGTRVHDSNGDEDMWLPPCFDGHYPNYQKSIEASFAQRKYRDEYARDEFARQIETIMPMLTGLITRFPVLSFLLDLAELRPSKHSRSRFDGVGTVNNANAKNLFGQIFRLEWGWISGLRMNFIFWPIEKASHVIKHMPHHKCQIEVYQPHQSFCVRG